MATLDDDDGDADLSSAVPLCSSCACSRPAHGRPARVTRSMRRFPYCLQTFNVTHDCGRSPQKCPRWVLDWKMLAVRARSREGKQILQTSVSSPSQQVIRPLCSEMPAARLIQRQGERISRMSVPTQAAWIRTATALPRSR